ncbi:P-loop containing nucleoside triphosphate hydrolase protein [Mycotypha africana]|uniref:P-loop containing nucleoside triphosphate hydrolase protein n=1 Tax=Mycotypha africana TaxID=64632 RepID=UPI00230159E1|nr:P-loop containing nucleoside triphosphate hydrolase protein [Mycotypha africana]KAI8970307.1 P-loop containing nucleoside triphosphate hydrolase protein [Mycotypha africana]
MPSTLKRKNGYNGRSEHEGAEHHKKPKLSSSSIDLNDDENASRIMDEDDGDIEFSRAEVVEDDEPVERCTNGQQHSLNGVDLTDMRINKAGTIARVELVNFMCHKYLKIDFGPKINFVIGHNGSGKSAILTAITLALGANASSTNRGRSLSDFIKNGASAANITIHLTNGGDLPYRPDIYSDMIIVERRINKDGPAPYKIKNASGRIVSTKKEDLIAILDYMNIVVTNPLTVLMQDKARKFLSDSSPEDKYELFMQGTQLTNLQDDFEAIRENLETARATLERKKQGLPALQSEANEAKKRYKDIQEAKQIEDNIDVLNNELVWSQIIMKEKQRDECKLNAEKAKRELDLIQEACNQQTEEIQTVDQSILQVTDELQAATNLANPDAEATRALLQKKVEQEFGIKSLKSDLQAINEEIKKTKKRKEQFERELKAEEEKLEASSRIKRDEISADMEKLRAQIQSKVSKAKQFGNEQKDLEKEIDEKKRQMETNSHSISSLKRRIDGIRDVIRNLQEQKGNRMRAYGQKMPDVLAAIRRENRWEGRRPVGPMGSTLQVAEPKYTQIIESVLNRSLNAFVVENFADKNLLFSILKSYKMHLIPIIVAEYDLFDYSDGEPDEQYLTVLRALKFEDEWVKRQLIIANKIEKMLLMDDRQRADEIMYNRPRNIDLCFTSNGYKVGGKSGSMKTESVEIYRGASRFQTDVDSRIREESESQQGLLRELQGLEQQARQLHSAIAQLNLRKEECKNSESGLKRQIQTIERQIFEKGRMLEENDPVDLSSFEEEIRECEEKLRSLFQQFQDVKKQEEAAKSTLRETLQELQVYQRKEKERQEYANEFRHKLNRLEEIKQNLIAKLDELKLQKQTMKARYESHHVSYQDCERTVRTWIEQSREDYPDRVETTRKPQEVEKEIKRLQSNAEQMESRMNMSLEELEQQTYDTLARWNEANDTIKGMEKLHRSLQRMLRDRMDKWEAFRQYIALSAKQYFSYYLHQRGDEGKLRFNHEKRQLDIRVSTGDQFVKGSRQKDSRSLSGGEKSFTQISLLLSLWQSISSPIICLDEFDVFMDAVNRKQTMNMIMNAASDNSSQYILITPQDASNMEPGPYVTVHRMADPER